MILLVEDSHADALALEVVLRSAHVRNPVFVVRDGREAIEYLKGTGSFADRSKHPLPTVVLLDLNMPRVDGFQVLEWIELNPIRQRPLIVVLTACDDADKLSLAYALGANSFLVKPCIPIDIENLVETYRNYWILDSDLPSNQTMSGMPAEQRGTEWGSTPGLPPDDQSNSDAPELT